MNETSKAGNPAKTFRELQEEEVEGLARRDFQRVAGKLVWVRCISGYTGQTDSFDRTLTTAALVRVERQAPEDCLCRWMDQDWLDPIYDVDLVLAHPQLAGTRAWWVQGQSYKLTITHGRGTIARGERSDILRPATWWEILKWRLGFLKKGPNITDKGS